MSSRHTLTMADVAILVGIAATLDPAEFPDEPRARAMVERAKAIRQDAGADGAVRVAVRRR